LHRLYRMRGRAASGAAANTLLSWQGDVVRERNLVRFGELDDVRIADGDADIRGWEVTTSDGREIGPVRELIVDVGSGDQEELMSVHLAEVELELRRFGLDGPNPRILMPIEHVRLDTCRRKVRLDVLSSAAALRLLPYEGGPITAEYERCFGCWVQVEAMAAAYAAGAAGVSERMSGTGGAGRRIGERGQGE
jgi:sporulation protein YlmC with PRC-barrel domain